jgi:endonuclease/exonuclease/phosphatase family metal-dependent hydrolase
MARGWLGVRFVHRDIGPVHAYNTHMQAFPENWLGRAKQARELGIILRTIAEETGDLVLVAGDFNSGPYYAKAEWTSPGGAVLDRWLHTAIAYPTLLTYGNLVDAAIMGRPQNDAIADVTLGDTVVNDADAALDIPGAEEGWCERTPNTTFTATDCNTLYFDQYAGTEYPARLDHVFVTDSERVIATDSRIVFTGTETFGDLVSEPSDHYGVRVDLLVSRAP